MNEKNFKLETHSPSKEGLLKHFLS